MSASAASPLDPKVAAGLHPVHHADHGGLGFADGVGERLAGWPCRAAVLFVEIALLGAHQFVGNQERGCWIGAFLDATLHLFEPGEGLPFECLAVHDRPPSTKVTS